jgi:hypothetical protein
MNNEPRDWKNREVNDQEAVFEIQDIYSYVIIKCRTFLLPVIFSPPNFENTVDYNSQSLSDGIDFFWFN